MVGKILCPIDFSSPSQAALRVAARLAQATGSQLVLAHAFHFPAVAAAHETSLPGKTLQLLMNDEKRGLEAAKDDAQRYGADKVTTEFLDGSPAHVITELAARGFDLIVVGTAGRTGFKRMMIGSVAENIVRHAPTSVLVVRGNPDGPYFDHVLCPVDFSEDSPRVLERAEQLAQPGGTGLDLVHAIELPLAASGDPLLVDFVNDADRLATNQLESLAEQVRKRNRTNVRSEVLTGHPAEIILAKAEEDRTIDLIAVGTHGRTGLRRMLLGSVAGKLVRHAPCSVLVVRARS